MLIWRNLIDTIRLSSDSWHTPSKMIPFWWESKESLSKRIWFMCGEAFPIMSKELRNKVLSLLEAKTTWYSRFRIYHILASSLGLDASLEGLKALLMMPDWYVISAWLVPDLSQIDSRLLPDKLKRCLFCREPWNLEFSFVWIHV